MLSQQQVWDMLPLSVESRKKIIADFVETGMYDTHEDVVAEREARELAYEQKCAHDKAEGRIIRDNPEEKS